MNSSPSPYLKVTRRQSTQRGTSSTSSCSTLTHSTGPIPSGKSNDLGLRERRGREPAALALPDHRRVEALLDRRPDREGRREVVALDDEVRAVADRRPRRSRRRARRLRSARRRRRARARRRCRRARAGRARASCSSCVELRRRRASRPSPRTAARGAARRASSPCRGTCSPPRTRLRRPASLKRGSTAFRIASARSRARERGDRGRVRGVDARPRRSERSPSRSTAALRPAPRPTSAKVDPLEEVAPLRDGRHGRADAARSDHEHAHGREPTCATECGQPHLETPVGRIARVGSPRQAAGTERRARNRPRGSLSSPAATPPPAFPLRSPPDAPGHSPGRVRLSRTCDAAARGRLHDLPRGRARLEAAAGGRSAPRRRALAGADAARARTSSATRRVRSAAGTSTRSRRRSSSSSTGR